jgi:U3 small nucleolar RNA-associated protein 11
MSSRAFRSVIKRREHLERHQPEARARFGLLEKHKDYVARAKNFHSKEKRLATLREKAANKNPDEFYFKMLSSRTKGGVFVGASERGRMSADMLAVLQTQDRGYVATAKAAEDARVARLQGALHVLPQAGAALPPLPSRHTVFVDSAEEAAAFDAAAFLDTDAALLGRTFNRPRRAQLAGGEMLGGSGAAAAAAGGGSGGGGGVDKEERRSLKRARRERDRAYAELDERMERSEKLGRLAQHMDLKRALLQKGKRVKVKEAEGDAPAVYKWKAERKR